MRKQELLVCWSAAKRVNTVICIKAYSIKCEYSISPSYCKEPFLDKNGTKILVCFVTLSLLAGVTCIIIKLLDPEADETRYSDLLWYS